MLPICIRRAADALLSQQRATFPYTLATTISHDLSNMDPRSPGEPPRLSGSVVADRGRTVPYEHVMRRASVAAVLAAMLLASGCGGGNGDESDNNPTSNAPSPIVATAVERALQNDTPVAQQIVAVDNAFGLALFNVLNQGATSNVAISPTSIALTLQMLFNGAEGSREQGMSHALQLQGALTSLGTRVAFIPYVADFADLASGVGVHISAVEHEAVVQVDESGTVAAGAQAAPATSSAFERRTTRELRL